MTEIMPFPENNIILFYWTAPQALLFLRENFSFLEKCLFNLFAL